MKYKIIMAHPQKLNRCKAFLKANGVFDQDSFVELTNE